MTWRSKDGLKARIALMFADNETKDITPLDVRTFLGDLVDSLQLQAEPGLAIWAAVNADAAVLTLAWIRANGNRALEGNVVEIPVFEPAVNSYFAFAIPESYTPLPAGYPRQDGGLGGALFNVVPGGDVGGRTYVVVRSANVYFPLFGGTDWRIRPDG